MAVTCLHYLFAAAAFQLSYSAPVDFLAPQVGRVTEEPLELLLKNRVAVAHRYAIFLCSLDVAIKSPQIAKGQYKDYLVGQLTSLQQKHSQVNDV